MTEGELVDFIEEFSDGRTQFGYVRVRDPNTGLPKNALVAWCGEGVPERTKGYFGSHLAAVGKLFHVSNPCLVLADYTDTLRDITSKSLPGRIETLLLKALYKKSRILLDPNIQQVMHHLQWLHRRSLQYQQNLPSRPHKVVEELLGSLPRVSEGWCRKET